MDKIKELIEQLKNKDVEFYTRFQENEWGIRYIGGGHFQKWNKNYIEDENTIENLNENSVIKLLSQYTDRDWSKYLVNTTQKVTLLSVLEKNKTLEELEDSVWKESTADTSMVEKVLSYRKIKLKDLTVEQI